MDWKQILDAVDDDYLVGISNKGIVKRAYKDKEELGATAQIVMEEEATESVVTVGGETVKICYPLGESKCSCPSRSICRHVVLGILLAKEQFGKQEIHVEVQSAVMEEIKAYPLKSLLRALGTKSLRSLVEKMQAQVLPEIQQTSIVTVKLPGQEMVVKLLSPLS